MRTTFAVGDELDVSEVRDVVVAAVGGGLEVAAQGVRTARVAEAGVLRVLMVPITMTIIVGHRDAHDRVVALAVVVVVGRAVDHALKRGTMNLTMSRVLDRDRTRESDEGVILFQRVDPGPVPDVGVVGRVDPVDHGLLRGLGLAVVHGREGGIGIGIIIRNTTKSITKNIASIGIIVVDTGKSIGTTMIAK